VQTETLGKGVAAVLIGAVVLAVLLSGMAIQRADAARDQAIQERGAAIDREAQMRANFSRVETESRMEEYYILELDGKLMAGGMIPPSRGYGNWKKEHSK
jgi:hypothetical protein